MSIEIREYPNNPRFQGWRELLIERDGQTWHANVTTPFAAEIERLQAMSRALEIAETALKAHEAWEADIILNADWSQPTPRLTQAQCDALPDVQAKRNEALTAIAAEPHQEVSS